MAFPSDPLDIRGEMYIDGSWVDVTTDIRGDGDITITGGQAPEQTSLTPCDISFSLNNRGGLYSDDNPSSTYYGLLPTNTPFRVSVVETETFLNLPNGISQDTSVYFTWEAAYAKTTDKAVLDVTGDLDLRIEVAPAVWSLGNAGHCLAAKYKNESSDRSWFWMILPSNRMRLYWSDDGTDKSATLRADSTEPVPVGDRIALRVTIDVNNGSSGRTITFYTSDSITGTWTQLGNTVVQSGTTSIFSGSADLHVGAFRNPTTGRYPFSFSTDDLPAGLPLVGRVYRFQMRNGIGGTLVADMNASAQAEGTTSWSDGLGTPNTWTLGNDASITAADYRGYGEIAEMPQEWDPTGADVYAPISANGIMRRLTQGASPLRSALYRNFRQFIGAGILNYWPLEDGSLSSGAASAVAGQPSIVFDSSLVQFQSDDDMPGADGVLALADDTAVLAGSVTAAASADWAFALFYIYIPVTPLAEVVFFNLNLTGGIAKYAFSVDSANYYARAYNSAGTLLATTSGSFTTLAPPGQWLGFQMRLTKNGTGVDLDLAWYVLATDRFFGTGGATATSTTIGAVRGFDTPSDAGLARARYSHIVLGNIDFEYVSTNFAQASRAWSGENAAERFLRVCEEEGVRARLVGIATDTSLMGPQPIATLAAALEECVQADGGLQYEARDQPAIMMRTRRSLFGQTALELDYTAKHLSGSFKPALDDYGLRNEITLTRKNGSSYVATRLTGKRSVADVGRYDTADTINPYRDDQLEQLAELQLNIGTFPSRRVPAVEVWLQRSVFVASASLTREIRRLTPGDRLSVANCPVWVGGGTQDTLIRGYTETLKNRGHEFDFSTTRYGPYAAGRYEDDNFLYDLSSCTLNGSHNASAVSLSLSMSVDEQWSTTAVPYDLMIAGEQVTVTAMGARSGSGSGPFSQTATVTRHVNGISKTLPDDSEVHIVKQGRYAL